MPETRAKSILAEVWLNYKDVICDLYSQYALDEVVKLMEATYGFTATFVFQCDYLHVFD